MQSLLTSLAMVVLLAGPWQAARAQADPGAPRGQLLYETHCIACHTTRMHWRAARRATDWASLQAQVRRWQANASLDWSEADITEVARHLNDTIYRFPAPERVGSAGRE